MTHHVLITGGSGFIGQALCPRLLAAGFDVSVLTRDARRAARALPPGLRLLESLDALADQPAVATVVNLAGEPLAGRRWNAARKAAFYRSRVDFTAGLVDYFSRAGAPATVVSGSAIGYYGPHGDEQLAEDGAAVDSFSRRLCAAWEQEALGFEALGSRVTRLRIGVVLDRGGGALAALLPAFRLGLGGPIASGRQLMSWIHRDDLVSLILDAIDREALAGAINATAPGAVTNREFATALGRALHRPARITTPGWAMRLLFGEMADELLISGQRVYPARALAAGFQFRYPDLASALGAIFAP